MGRWTQSRGPPLCDSCETRRAFSSAWGSLRRSYSVAMPQPWRDGRSAGRTPTRVLRMKRRTSLQQAGALRPRCPAGKGLSTPTAGRCCMRRAYHSATAAVPPWTAVGRAGPRSVETLRVRDGTLQVSRAGNAGKAGQWTQYAEQSCYCPAFLGLSAQSVYFSSMKP